MNRDLAMLIALVRRHGKETINQHRKWKIYTVDISDKQLEEAENYQIITSRDVLTSGEHVDIWASIK